MSKAGTKPFTLYDPAVPLPKIYKKRAQKELKEIPDQVSAHLESFRRWIKSMPHLQCPTDDTFLLAFLRHAKYNHLKAQRRLDNFCTFRTSETEGNPTWFNPKAQRKELWDALINMRSFTPFGFTENGVYVFVVKGANTDMEKMTMGEVNSASQIFNDTALLDPRMQIGGMAMVMDLSGITKDNFFKMADRIQSKLSTKYFQEALPYRIAKLIYYNAPKYFEAVYKVTSQWLNEKIKSRIIICGADLTPAFEALPGLKELMPQEFGGSNESSYDEISDAFASLSEQLFDQLPDLSIAVNESKRPSDCRNMMKDYKDLPDLCMGKSGVYVKLNDDEI